MPLTEEEEKENRKAYANEVIEKLNLNRTNDLEGFTVNTRAINLKSALTTKTVDTFTFAWPLLFTGVCLELTPLKGSDIMNLSPERDKYQTLRGLNTVFSIIYSHVVNKGKPDFQTWLRQICDYDIDSILFGLYAATFKDNNYLGYTCNNPKCKKISLQKKDIMEMVVFPDDNESKEKFHKLLNKESIGTRVYKTHPKRINKDYAIGFTTQNIYSNLFEPTAVGKTVSDRYSDLISIMPFIDRVYKIDNELKTLTPINFGVVENSLSKTVERRIKGLAAIFQQFSSDERFIIISESGKIARKLNPHKFKYVIPETECPYCHQPIAEQEMNPLELLFMRAQLPIDPAITQELN